MAELSGKVAVVTGGSRGIGKIAARLFAESGASVAICARNIDTLNAARDELSQSGAEIMAISADITDRKSVDAAIAEIGKSFFSRNRDKTVKDDAYGIEGSGGQPVQWDFRSHGLINYISRRL